MLWKDVNTGVVWTLHLASGGRLGAAVVRAFDSGLEPEVLATRTSTGARSVTVLGVDHGGATRTYTEVELVDTDATQAHEHLRLDDVLASARAMLARADACLDAVREGKPLPLLRQPKGAS